MLSDVALVALIGAGATVLVAVANAFTQIFGSTYRDARQRKAERELARDDRRFDRAEALIKATSAAVAGRRATLSGAFMATRAAARTEFVATLRKGEGAVATFVTTELIGIDKTVTGAESAVDELADTLFAYLRGDLTLTQLHQARQNTAAPRIVTITVDE